jgi:hypothetical protein
MIVLRPNCDHRKVHYHGEVKAGIAMGSQLRALAQFVHDSEQLGPHLHIGRPWPPLIASSATMWMELTSDSSCCIWIGCTD